MARVFLTHSPVMLENYYGPRALAALEAMAEVRINPTGRVLDQDGLHRHAAGASIVVSDRQTSGEAAFFEGAHDLAAFLRCAVDIRNIDVAAASRHGILVTRASPGFATSVAELALGLIIDRARGISDAAVEYRAGRIPTARMGRELRGATLGIIGYGVIGRTLAPLGLALGMSVAVCDPHAAIDDANVHAVSLDELLATADFVVCLAAATPETENLLGADQFARMKADVHFINLSRGNLVDEAALGEALDAGRIAGAALDVGRAPDQMPSPALAGRAEVTATPHIGGLTPGAIERQALDTVEQVRGLLAGEIPRGAVNAGSATRLALLRT